MPPDHDLQESARIHGVTTDRYVRRGGPIPQIYPGTLKGITQALRDCVSASKFLPDTSITLWAVQDGQQALLREFGNGVCTWHANDNDEAEYEQD